MDWEETHSLGQQIIAIGCVIVSTPTFDTFERAKAVIELVTDQHVLGQVRPTLPRTTYLTHPHY